MGALKTLAYVLVGIGAVNWGLVGFFDYNLVTSLLGDGTTLTILVYDLVGLSGLWVLYDYFMSGSSMDAGM